MARDERPWCFNPGPAMLPASVREEAARAVRELEEPRLSVLEISHRGPTFEGILREARDGLRELLGVPDTHEILFLQGGARTQFAQVPLNFLTEGTSASHVVTGIWAEGAHEEASRLGEARVLASSKERDFRVLPSLEGVEPPSGTAYVHTTSNNTVIGTQWPELPDFGEVPHVCDMSSDFLSRPFDVSRFSLVYAGAQKNVGPAGVTLVIVDRRWMEAGRDDVPAIWHYGTHAAKGSTFNTPPVFAIHVVGLMVRWLADRGGLEAIAERNEAKARAVYEAIERSGGFYRPVVEEPAHRSRMNPTFTISDDGPKEGAELVERFLAEADEAGLQGLKGHRKVGGLRASLYNAMPLEGAERLASFMDDFARRHG